jgi:uncharacterized membrane protein YecN with MAPEG domain
MDVKLQIYFLTLSFFAFQLLYLSINVIKNRRKYLVLYGAKGHIILKAAIRAQANFIEYVPITLLLFSGLIFYSIPNWLFVLLCLLFVVSRVLHSVGLLKYERYEPPVLKPRFFGMIGTFTVIIFSAGYIFVNTLYMLIF